MTTWAPPTEGSPDDDDHRSPTGGASAPRRRPRPRRLGGRAAHGPGAPPWFGVAKVGPRALQRVGARRRRARSSTSTTRCSATSSSTTSPPRWTGRPAWSARSAPRYLNFHAQGGAAMLTAGVDGFLAGAASAGLPTPIPLAVTILTSDDQAPAHILQKRVQAALESGCRGIVCAASDVHEAKQYGPRLTAVVPGIRPAGHAHARSGPGRHPRGGDRRRGRRARPRTRRHPRGRSGAPRPPRWPTPSRASPEQGLGSRACRSLPP